MNILSRWKVLLVIAALLLAAWFLYPTIRWYSMTPAQVSELQKVDYSSWRWLNANKLNLGLDLQGGVSLLLKIDIDSLQQMSLDKEIEKLNTEFISKNNSSRAAFSANSTSVVITYPDDIQGKSAEDIVKNLTMLTKKESPQGQLIYEMDPRMVSNRVLDTMEQARHVIENRVNELGLSETNVTKVGNDRISVQLPGETDPERATNIIRRQAFLEFKIVADDALLNSILNEQGQLRPGAVIPDGYEFKQLRESKNGEIISKPLLLKKRAEMTGDRINSAMVRNDSFSMGASFVELRLDRDGARIFERVTAMNVKKRLAIVLDGEVKSAPEIQERIPNGQARITGQFTQNEVKDLALVLRSGALPAPLIIEESRTVGPSLGYDSIHKGILSSIIAAILVILFMLIYYRGSGLIANIALAFNILFLIASMAGLGATLTVPGIAGIVLTIGMAVDANILIFERIREELRGGKTPRAAIESGYNRAFAAIFDSNITTMISCFVLYEFGRGAVRGFAVTLGVGIAINLFTAVFITKLIFDWISLKPGFKKVSI